MESGEEVASFYHEWDVHGVAFSPDGNARAQPWQPEGLMNEARASLTRNLSGGEWRQYVGGLYNETYPDLPVPEDQELMLTSTRCGALVWRVA